MSEALLKDASISRVVEQLRAHLGPDAFTVADHWEADRCAVGLAAPGEPARLAYISTFGRPPGRYDVSLELPPAPRSDVAYTPAGDRSDLDFDALASLLRDHLRVA